MIRIAEIQRFCMHDGPGIRTTVFFKGCSLNCVWCHNPETQSKQSQILFYENKCIGCQGCADCRQNAHSFSTTHSINRDLCVACGECVNLCPTNALELVGKDYTAEELLGEIKKDVCFYGETGGVSFSGGECMLQIESLLEILKKCKENNIHTAVDTSGCVPFEYFERILPYTDLFLYDIKCFDEETHKKYVGVSNALILENLTRLLKYNANVWVRVPVVPSVNDSIDEMKKIKAFLDSVGKPLKIELLPYHPMGETKCRAAGMSCRTFSTPTPEKMRELKAIFGADPR